MLVSYAQVSAQADGQMRVQGFDAYAQIDRSLDRMQAPCEECQLG